MSYTLEMGFEDFIKFVFKTSKILSNIIKCRLSSSWMLRCVQVEELENSGQRQYISHRRIVFNIFCNSIYIYIYQFFKDVRVMLL